MASDNYLKDLQLTRRSFDVQTSDREYVDLRTDGGGDLATVSGRDNLAQAILNRLLTRQGELKVFGHPRYGSRLHTLIGQPNNLRVRGLADAYIREALAAESRIAEILFISFDAPGRGDGRSTLRAELGIQPLEGAPINLSIPINLEG